MQPGARFAAQLSSTSDRSVCTLSDLEPNGHRAAGATIYVGNIGRTLDHDAITVHDVTRAVGPADERFAALYDTIDETILLEVANETVDVTLVLPVSRAMRRVVAAHDRWYVASDAEVHALAHRTAPSLDLLTVDAIDLAMGTAGDATLLCVVDARGLTWFDATNAVVERRTIGSPTAIAGDPLAGGWLVAADGDVWQFASPSAAPRRLACSVGLATRIRRDVDALYAALASGELVEVPGVRHGPTDARPHAIAAFARGFTEFDAAFALYIDDGSGPRRFEP